MDRGDSGVKSWSLKRLLEAAPLLGWAAVFWTLLLTGRTQLYLASRVDWLVKVGAVGFTALAIARLATGRSRRRERPRPMDLVRTGIVVAPVVFTLAVPPTVLGSFAVTRRSVATGGVVTTDPQDLEDGDLSLVDVAGATRERAAMQALAQRAGDEVSFTGFVTKDPQDGADEFDLNRFLVVCHVGDALNISVHVVQAPPGEVKQDQWVRITGALYPMGDDVIVAASELEKIAKPDQPYLYP